MDVVAVNLVIFANLLLIKESIYMNFSDSVPTIFLVFLKFPVLNHYANFVDYTSI